MSRFWLGVGILAVILALSLGVMFAMDSVCAPISQNLEKAAQAGLSGNLSRGLTLLSFANSQWQNRWNALASVADHAPMDDIDGLFSQAEFYARCGDSAAFSATCSRLSQLVEAVSEAHRLTWWNFL